MSGDFEDWDGKPAKDFRSKQDFKETKRERNIGNLVAALLAIAVATFVILSLMGVIK